MWQQVKYALGKKSIHVCRSELAISIFPSTRGISVLSVSLSLVQYVLLFAPQLLLDTVIIASSSYMKPKGEKKLLVSP